MARVGPVLPSRWRHIAAAIVKAKFSKGEMDEVSDGDDDDEEEAEMQNHSVAVARMAYAGSRGLAVGSIEDQFVLRKLRVCELWQGFFGMECGHKRLLSSAEDDMVGKRVAMAVGASDL